MKVTICGSRGWSQEVDIPEVASDQFLRPCGRVADALTKLGYEVFYGSWVGTRNSSSCMVKPNFPLYEGDVVILYDNPYSDWKPTDPSLAPLYEGRKTEIRRRWQNVLDRCANFSLSS